MCLVSNIGDKWSKQDYWPAWPGAIPFPDRKESRPYSFRPIDTYENIILKERYTQLKEQAEKMKRELEQAKAEDIKNNNPDCEMEDKVIILKKIAKMLDIDLSAVFKD